MLGIGLHSYGFTEAAFWWLSAFIVSQLALIAIGGDPVGEVAQLQDRAGSSAGRRRAPSSE